MDIAGLLDELYGRIPPLARGRGRRARRRHPRRRARARAPTPSPGWCGTRRGCRTTTSSELLDAEQLWQGGDWAARFGLDPDPQNTGLRPHRRRRRARAARRIRTCSSSTSTPSPARTKAMLRDLDAGRPRPHRRPPLGSAGHARRAARERRRRQPAAPRPGRLRPRPPRPLTRAIGAQNGLLPICASVRQAGELAQDAAGAGAGELALLGDDLAVHERHRVAGRPHAAAGPAPPGKSFT